MKRERTPEQIAADKERMARIRAMRTTTATQLKIPNVPRPDFVSVFQWNRWLRDNGFEVEDGVS